jgi:hypothetical protein
MLLLVKPILMATEAIVNEMEKLKKNDTGEAGMVAAR